MEFTDLEPGLQHGNPSLMQLVPVSSRGFEVVYVEHVATEFGEICTMVPKTPTASLWGMVLNPIVGLVYMPLLGCPRKLVKG